MNDYRSKALRADSDSCRSGSGVTLHAVQGLNIDRGDELYNTLRETNLQLEQRVREETERRLQQERILIHQSRMAAMGEMMGAIAHQWRQPLNVLALTIQNLKEAMDMGDLNAELVDSTVERSMQHILFMSQTIDDFRNFFRSEQLREPFDIKSSVEDILAIMSGQLVNHDIAVRVICEGDADELVFGCRNEFKHVVLNLLVNAHDAILERKAVEHGLQGTITIRIIREFGAVLMKVHDNGSGVPEALFERIFDPYFTTKEEGKGSGIGLYMSKIIVERNLQGRLQLDSGPEGTVFTVLLPSCNPQRGNV